MSNGGQNFRLLEEALQRPELAAYRGWLKFLRFEAAAAAQRSGPADETAVTNARRLDDWTRRIADNPDLLATLRGVQEWAYESPVDGSGQPFKMAIPADYDGVTPMVLNVYMHGSGGNHLEHATELAAQPGAIEVAVLGRARDGGYRALSEADVLHAIDYIEAHWAIDPDRIRLKGGSMGGGGTYRLGTRFPHRWASGRPTCGYASHLPIANLLTLPVYATHSADDWVVSVMHQRAPLARLRAVGGQAILDETNGLGHAAWDYKEGNERGAAWVGSKTRPATRSVRRLEYTALDGTAVRSWWAEIVEWGDQPGNARFALTAGDASSLYAELTNIARLRLRLDESPFDRTRSLQVSVNGAIPLLLPAPLPASVELVHGTAGWKFATEPGRVPFRLHTPGSASLLYNGEPLLLVYGTRGTEVERIAMQAAADSASRSPSPVWPDDKGDAGPEGVPNNRNLYGQLPVKADAAVTDSDLARCHLVLIGTAAQNSVVARLAEALPVRFARGEVTCSDGVTFHGRELALGLVHFNPLAPERLIFWVASDTPATYAAGSLIPLLMAGGASLASNPFGADLLILAGAVWTMVAARSFDSRWRWTPGRASSPLLDATFSTSAGLSGGVAKAICRATGADFALVGSYGSPECPPVAAGVTRVSDLAPLFANIPLGHFEIAGAGLLDMASRIRASNSGLLLPGLDETKIDPARNYRVALPVDQLWKFSQTLEMAPASYVGTRLDTRDAVERFLAS
jgi:dienelactone hydrolase